MLSAYPACFVKGDHDWSVIFPDLDFTATCGATLDEAFAKAVECLAGYLHACKIEGKSVPSASEPSSVSVRETLRELGIGEIPEGSFVNVVTVDAEEYARNHFARSVKKTLSIPKWLNDLAVEHGINFSQTLQRALKSELGVL
ncbi:MAG: type II toxin-antitoxin system HicB family antitoxin [Pyramidobacter sp.]|nr:type II toxin-antitoxin system HicB family antitoxin [Pyramidobacter sp.]